MTDKNPPVAVSPIGGDVVAAVVRGGVGFTIGVSSRRGIAPVPVAMAVAGVTVADVAVGAVSCGASFDAAKIGLAAAIETAQSDSTIEARRTSRDVARRSARGTARRKASDRSGQSTAGTETQRRTAATEARRRTGEAGRRTSEHRRRTRRRSGQLCKRCTWRGSRGTEQHAKEGEKSLHRHCVSPSIYTFDWIAR
jgi:hypothetical protein